MDLIDLHVHSTCSDGTLSPGELVDYALQKGLKAFALTDHDTIAGLAQAFLAAAHTPMEVVAGIEFSTDYHHKGIHIVGLDLEYMDSGFRAELQRFQNSRRIRNEQMVQKMQADGVQISMERLQEIFGESIVTRAHLARYLADNGYAADIADAFARFVNKGGRYYVPRQKVTPHQAVDLIFQCGGIPVLAHPMQYQLSGSELDELIVSLKEVGLIGIEVFYSTHRAADEAWLGRLADRHVLLPSGGSDFHGSNKPSIDLGTGCGNLCIPYECLANLRGRRKEL